VELEEAERVAQLIAQLVQQLLNWGLAGAAAFVLLAVTLAYMAQVGDTRIDTATFFTTQVDFTEPGDLKVFVYEEQITAREREMGQRGYLEGKKMAKAFNLLRSNDLIWPYVIHNYLKGKEPAPFDLLYWNADATRMTAANHSFYLRNCYLENNFSQGRMTIAGSATQE